MTDMGIKSNLGEARTTAQALQSDLQGVAQAAEQAGSAFGGIGNGRFGPNPFSRFGPNPLQGRFAQGPTGPRGGSSRGGIVSAGRPEGSRFSNDSPGNGEGIVVIGDPRGPRGVLERLGPGRGTDFLGARKSQQDLARVAAGIEKLVEGQRNGGTLYRAGSR